MPVLDQIAYRISSVACSKQGSEQNTIEINDHAIA